MRRLLFSVFSLGLALTLLVAGSAFAAFTDTASDSGTVTAGTADIRLNFAKGVDEVIWDGVGCTSDNMTPGDTCVDNVKVHNDGTVDLYYTVSDIDGYVGATLCFDVSFSGPVDNVDGGDGNTPGFIGGNNAEVETIDIEVTLIGDNACQGASGLVGISVAASTSP